MKGCHFISLTTKHVLCDKRHIRQFPETVNADRMLDYLFNDDTPVYRAEHEILDSTEWTTDTAKVLGGIGVIIITLTFLCTLAGLNAAKGFIVGTYFGMVCEIMTITGMCVRNHLYRKIRFINGYADYCNGYKEVLSFAKLDIDDSWYKVSRLNSKILIGSEDLWLLGMYDAMCFTSLKTPNELTAFLCNEVSTPITKKHVKYANAALPAYVECKNTMPYPMTHYMFKVYEEDLRNASEKN